MSYTLKILQIAIAGSLVFLTLIQSKGKGLASGVAGGISMYRSRRGLERAVFVLTIILSVALAVNSLLLVIFV